jgi:hypothetical protein
MVCSLYRLKDTEPALPTRSCWNQRRQAFEYRQFAKIVQPSKVGLDVTTVHVEAARRDEDRSALTETSAALERLLLLGVNCVRLFPRTSP